MRSTYFSIGLASALVLGTGGSAVAQRGHGGGHVGGHVGGGHFGGGHLGGGHVGGVGHVGGGHFGGGHLGGGYAGGGRLGGSHFGGAGGGYRSFGHAGHYGYGSGYGYGGWGYGHHSYWPSYGYGYGYGSSYGYPYWPSYDYGYGTDLSFGLPLSAGWGDYYDPVPTYDYSAVPTYGEPVPAEPDPATVAPAPAQPVTLTILLPTPDAELFLDGMATTLQGAERKFQSPPVEPGQNYHYKITARWVANGQTVEQTQDVPVTAGQAVTVDFRGQAQ